MATKYARLKTHWIVNLSRIYKGGDKGSTSQSANSVTAEIDTKFAAFEATQLQLQENQCQLGDAMNVLVQNNNTLLLGGGGIPPMIDTKTVAGGLVSDYSMMMAQNAQLIAALANLQSSLTVNTTAGTGQTVINY